jgi:metal-sulfur cluster biosynthetic enzyme
MRAADTPICAPPQRRRGDAMARQSGKQKSAPDHLIRSHEAEVWACLDGVTDPELDESVTELNFVTDVEVRPKGQVYIGFRLPTYWCAANFSFLMADDMRRAVGELDWVTGVKVVLGEHMYADTINAGLAKGLSFQETFGAEADGDLDDLRRTFLLKAFQRRQAALLQHLIAMGHTAASLAAMSLHQLEHLSLDAEGGKLVRRYIERRDVAGCARAGSPAFVTAENAPLQADSLASYLTGLRRVGINAEFNSALCRGLLSVRFDLETPFVPRAKVQASSSTTVNS